MITIKKLRNNREFVYVNGHNRDVSIIVLKVVCEMSSTFSNPCLSRNEIFGKSICKTTDLSQQSKFLDFYTTALMLRFYTGSPKPEK